MKIVVDTNVLVSACFKRHNFARQIIRLCIKKDLCPIIGDALFFEYEDVLTRKNIFANSELSQSERQVVYDAFIGSCSWTQIYYSWRPNLRDEGDNHLIELAVAGGAQAVITANVGDFVNAQLRFSNLKIVNSEDFLKTWSEK